ncbi:MAG: hypothetical protein PHO42_05670 [Candidatus Omnitrophica bacterium]|nr:hypothetical protein [Candidatus Omnitrophota bacterium]
MLAAFILLSVILSIIAAYMTAFDLVYTSRNMTFAVNSAKAKMEEIRDYNFYNIYADYNNQTFTTAELPAGKNIGIIYVDNSDPDMLMVTISICWAQGSRVIGEDQNLNGVLDGGEDANNNTIIDSPAQLVSLIVAR